MSLFAMGMPPWFYKQRAVRKGLESARDELQAAPAGTDAERDAKHKVARFEHASERLVSERKHTMALASALLTYRSENV